MNHFEDDVLGGDSPSEDQHAARLRHFQVWFGRFVSFLLQQSPHKATELKWIDRAPERINHDYWELMYERVKPKIITHPGRPKRADRHKIASLVELIINWHQPLVIDDEERRRKLNAQLAYFCAVHIIANWDRAKLKQLNVSESFMREHLAWLTAMPDSNGSGALPIFSNAATWYLVELIFFARRDNKAP